MEIVPFSPDGYGNHYCFDVKNHNIVFWEHDSDYIQNKPDITGEINSHNIDADSHADIRQALDLLTNGASAEEIDGVKDLISYVNKHGAEVTQMQADIKANKNNISNIMSNVIVFEEISSNDVYKNVQLKYGENSLYPQTTAANVTGTDYATIAFDVAEMITYE